jgi:hypothetical protein
MLHKTRIQNTPPQYTAINLVANFVHARFHFNLQARHIPQSCCGVPHYL